MVVALDSGPLGMASNPKPSVQNDACNQWLRTLISAGCRIVVPEIADYEVRRELLRANKMAGIQKLDALAASLEYLSLSTTAMRLAAEFWAKARQQGYPTATDAELDCDVILAAQVALIEQDSVIVATTNVSHLERYVNADVWGNITL